MNVKSIAQIHPMGCGIACVASVLGITYENALSLFQNKTSAWTTGYYCQDIQDALIKAGHKYHYKEVLSQNDPVINQTGVIVFCDYCDEYPQGHYMVKMDDGWMNPWANYPAMNPAEADIVNKLPSPVSWVIYQCF